MDIATVVFNIIFFCLVAYLVYRHTKKTKEDEEADKVQEYLNKIREEKGLKPIRNRPGEEATYYTSSQAQECPTAQENQVHYQEHGNEKGEYGEWLTEYALKSIEGYRFILRNVYIPYRNGTSELDLILLHEKGIYVFESKDYSGWIFGSADNQYWTQVFNKNSKYKFYNPIKQNKTHIKAIRACLGLSPSNPIRSFIVFSDKCELKDVPASTEETKICRRKQMMDILREDLKDRPVVYDICRLDGFKNRLHKYTIVTEEEKEKHRQQAQKYKKREP